MAAIIDWLFDPTNGPTVGAWAFLLGVFGTGVTIIGFGITLAQLRRTATNAEAAKRAAEAVKSRVATYDAVFEVSRATAALRETQRHLRIGALESAVDSYVTVREALVRLIELPSPLGGEERARIGAMLSDITVLCDKIEAGLQRGKPPDVTKAIKSARDHGALMTRLRIVIEKGGG